MKQGISLDAASKLATNRIKSKKHRQLQKTGFELIN